MLWIEIENLSFFVRSSWQKIIAIKLFKFQAFKVFVIVLIRFEKVVQFWTHILPIQNVREECGYENLIVFCGDF